MEIKVLGSSSQGNCYRISDGVSAVLIECGLPIKLIRTALNFSLSGLSGCLISHEHKDHAKAAADLIKAGVDLYMSAGTSLALGISGHRVWTVVPRQMFKVGTFNILPFDTEHDAAEPLGFLIISTVTKERLMFATDTVYLRYKFSWLTHIMIEANYALDILDSNVESGRIPESLRNRIRKSHCSLETVKEFLKANDLSNVLEIHLIHLSDGNSDQDRFKREIQELTGKMVFVA